MKLLFAHDHCFYKYDGKYYSTGGLSKKMLERYTRIFEKVNVVSRQRQISKLDDGLTLASAVNVDFFKVPDFKSLKNFKNFFMAKRIVQKHVKESDCVIARVPSSIGEIAIKYAKKYNKPYLVEIVACPWDSLWNHSVIGKLVAPFSYMKMKKSVKNAPYSIYVTNSFLQSRYPTNGEWANCSNVALTEFDDESLQKRIDKINKIDNQKIIIGTTAAVNVMSKGQQYIIEALGVLKKKGITNYEYQLVGGGDQDYLKSIAHKWGLSDQIKFLGNISHEEVFNWLETIDLYVQPSRQEGLPRALIEAMSRAVPSFGARTAGIPELLEDKFLFSNSKNNINEICTILLDFDKSEMLKQSNANYQLAKKYDSKIIESRRRDILEKFKSNINQK